MILHVNTLENTSEVIVRRIIQHRGRCGVVGSWNCWWVTSRIVSPLFHQRTAPPMLKHAKSRFRCADGKTHCKLDLFSSASTANRELQCRSDERTEKSKAWPSRPLGHEMMLSQDQDTRNYVESRTFRGKQGGGWISKPTNNFADDGHEHRYFWGAAWTWNNFLWDSQNSRSPHEGVRVNHESHLSMMLPDSDLSKAWNLVTRRRPPQRNIYCCWRAVMIWIRYNNYCFIVWYERMLINSGPTYYRTHHQLQ